VLLTSIWVHHCLHSTRVHFLLGLVAAIFDTHLLLSALKCITLLRLFFLIHDYFVIFLLVLLHHVSE
jgi:hypothetical protein